jgi:DNA-binding MarR family transcriptional regulator
MGTRFLSPIHKACREIEETLAQRCAGLEISAIEGQILSFLASYSPSPVSALHEKYGIKRSTLTGILDRLETRGWIVRQTSSRDRRSLLVSLSDAGRAEAARVQRIVEELEADIAASLSPEAVEGFYAILAAINRSTSPR